MAALERRFNGVEEPAVRADLANLPHHLDRLDRWIAQEVLTTTGVPNAADLQIAPSVRLLLTLDDLTGIFEGRRAAVHARHWFPQYAGHVPRGAFPATWLPGRFA